MKKFIVGAVLILLPLTAYTSMIIVAYSHNAGPIETQAYDRSRLYDQEKSERKRFEQLGLKLQADPGVGQCQFQITGAGQDLRDAKLIFKRPDNAGDDFSIAWRQALTASFPRRGWWLVEFHGQLNDETVRAETEIYIP